MRAVLAVIAFVIALTFAANATSSANGPRSTVTARHSSYGRILFDGRGFALYAFARDRAGRSACANARAKTRPPYTVARRAAASRGVKSSLLGTVKRRDGRRQVTHAGRPLYYHRRNRDQVRW
jgi:predicted lipoprotein with Yx(FWY)xxD motif